MYFSVSVSCRLQLRSEDLAAFVHSASHFPVPQWTRREETHYLDQRGYCCGTSSYQEGNDGTANDAFVKHRRFPSCVTIKYYKILLTFPVRAKASATFLLRPP